MAIQLLIDYSIPRDNGINDQFCIIKVNEITEAEPRDITNSFPKSMPHIYFESETHAINYLKDLLTEIKEEEISFKAYGKYPLTVVELIEMLKMHDPASEVTFGGLDFYRVKRRGEDVVQIEFNQTVYRDEDGVLQIRE